MTPEQLIDLMDRYGIEHRKATEPEIQELLKKLDEYMACEFGLEIETHKLKLITDKEKKLYSEI